MVGKIIRGMAEKVSAKLAKREGMHAVGDPSGLYLCVADGARSWILRYSFAGRRREMGLGSYSDLSLAQARENAREQRALIRQGVDPIEAKRERLQLVKAARAARRTFNECVTGYIDSHGDGWRNPKHRAQWQSTMDTYAGPVIGDLDVSRIETPHILKVLEPIWKEKTETCCHGRRCAATAKARTRRGGKGILTNYWRSLPASRRWNTMRRFPTGNWAGSWRS
jgi:hypothetical protein